MIDRQFDTQCPHCGVTNDGLLALTTDDTPNDGDVLLCYSCGCFSVWHDGMVPPTPQEFEYIGGNPVCQAMQLTWMEMHS